MKSITYVIDSLVKINIPLLDLVFLNVFINKMRIIAYIM